MCAKWTISTCRNSSYGRSVRLVGVAHLMCQGNNDDDDDDEGRINFSMALSPKTKRTGNNKLKQRSHVIVVSATRRS